MLPMLQVAGDFQRLPYGRGIMMAAPFVPPVRPIVVTAEQLAKFCDAVRAKEDWSMKILNKQRGLALKWAIEAKLLPEDTKGPSDSDDESAQSVFKTIEKLKAEARRLCELDHTIRLDTPRLPPRLVDYQTIDADTVDSLKYARNARFALRAPLLKEEVGVYTSDGLVPPSLHKELVAELSALAALEPKDFHPRTDGKVQDLIHPSLYPFIAGVTPTNDPSRTPRLDEHGIFHTEMQTMWNTPYDSKYAWIPSVFRMSDDGTDVRIQSYINGLGPRDRFPDLYRIIEKVFLLALPHFERVLAFKFDSDNTTTDSQRRWLERGHLREGTTHEIWENFMIKQQDEKLEKEESDKLVKQKLEAEMEQEMADPSKFYSAEYSTIASPWKGQDLKVIVKAADYILGPSQEYEGTWHVEGMPHERIVASLIYYYDSDERIQDRGLQLRRMRDDYNDFPNTDDYMHESFDIIFKENDNEEEEEGEQEPNESDYPSDWEDEVDYQGNVHRMSTSALKAHITLGTVPTTTSENESIPRNGHGTGRMLSFPNWIQHKVVGLKNSEQPETNQNEKLTAKRRILCFFLVQDPPEDEVQYHGFRYVGLKDMNVLTTSDVPSQERLCNTPTLRFLLAIGCRRLTGTHLPPELVDHILGFGYWGLSREAAEQHRRALMEDRTFKYVYGKTRDLWNELYSLCEH